MPQIQARGEPLYPPHFVIRADSLVLVRVSRVRCVPQAERRRLVSRCSSKNAKTTDSRARERLCWRLDDNEDYDDVQLYVNRMPIRIRNKDRGRGGGGGVRLEHSRAFMRHIRSSRSSRPAILLVVVVVSFDCRLLVIIVVLRGFSRPLIPRVCTRRSFLSPCSSHSFDAA